MDFSTKQWHLFRRLFPSRLRVHSADYLLQKNWWISTVLKFPSFSFVLDGHGEFRHRGRIWPIVAPCLMVEWPGDLFEYGPSPGRTWSEFYIKFEPDSLAHLLDCGFIDKANPVRPIFQVATVQKLIQELSDIANSSEGYTKADWVDRHCEQIILSALTPGRLAVSQQEADVFKRMEGWIKGRFEDISLDDLARQFHMSPQTFRRRCFKLHQMSPIRYLTKLRIEESGRLLIETVLTVEQVAKRTGFKDPHYFSRRFRQEMGKSPSEYRRSYPPYSLPPALAHFSGTTS